MSYYPELQKTEWQQQDNLDLSKTAVLVIDILGGSNGVAENLQEAADNAVSVVKAARAKDIPVFFCNDSHILGVDKELELWGEHGIVGTEGSVPYSAFDVQDSDFMIPKRRYDSFFQTDLDLTLRELGVDTLIVIGFDTNICVLQTLGGAYMRGYKTICVGDACESFLVGDHEEGLKYFAVCYDTRIVDTEKALSYIQG